MTKDHRPVVALSVLMLVAVGGLSTSVDFAQATTNPTDERPAAVGEVEKEPSAPPPIAVSELALKAEQTTNRIREIRASLAPDTEVARIQDELLPTIAGLDDLEESEAELERFSPSRLIDPRGRLQRQQSILQDWSNLLKQRSKSLGGWRAELRDQRQLWELTMEAEAELLPDAVRERIRALVRTIDELDSPLGKRLDTVLTLQDRVSEQQLRITASFEMLQKAEKANREQLFRLDSLPIWAEFSVPQDDATLASQVKQSWADDSARVSRFTENYVRSIQFHIGLLVALSLLLVVLGRRTNLTEADEDVDLKATAHVLRRPVTSALLISLTLTYWIYPGKPTVVGELNLLLLLIPVLRLLPGLIYSSMRHSLYGLAGLFVLDQLAELALDDSLLQRVLLLLVTVLALAGAAWVVRPGGQAATLSGGRWWKATVALGRVSILILAVSVIANLVGNVSLSNLLTNGVLNSAYVATVLFAGAWVLRGAGIAFLRTPLARTSRAVRTHTEILRRRVRTGIQTVAFLVWGWATLQLFGLYDPLRAGLVATLSKQWTFGSMSVSLGGVLAFVLTLYVSILISRFIRFVLNEDVLPHLALPRGVAATISMLVNYFIIALGFFIAVSAAGFELSQFALIAGALGVGIGFGLQNIVNNFVSGLVLIFERPIQIGDTVQLGELRGQVRRIGIRASIVRTFDGAEVIVPNGDLISSQVINWTLSDRTRRAEVFVGVKYGTDPNQVLELLVQAARNHEDVLEFPEPRALFRGFGESSLDFSVRFWTAGGENWLPISSDVTVAINNALKEAGIEIPFPQRDLHVRSVDPEARGVVSESEGVTTQIRAASDRGHSPVGHGPTEPPELPDE